MLQINRLTAVNDTTGKLDIPYEKPYLLAARVFTLEDCTISLECHKDNSIIQKYEFRKKPHFFIMNPPAQCFVNVRIQYKEQQKLLVEFETGLEWYIIDSECLNKPLSYRLKVPCLFHFDISLPHSVIQLQMKIWPKRKSALLASRTPFKASSYSDKPTCFNIPSAEEPYCYQYRYKFSLGNETIAMSEESPIFVMDKIPFEKYFVIDKDYLEATHKARILCISKDWDRRLDGLNYYDQITVERQINPYTWEHVYTYNGYQYWQSNIEKFCSNELKPNQQYRILINGYSILEPFSVSQANQHIKSMEFIKPYTATKEFSGVVATCNSLVHDYFFDCYARFGKNRIFYAKWGEETIQATYEWLTDSSVQIVEIPKLLYCKSILQEWEKEEFSCVKDVFREIVSFLPRQTLQILRGQCKYLYAICSKRYMVLQWNAHYKHNYFYFRGYNLLDNNSYSVYYFR